MTPWTRGRDVSHMSLRSRILSGSLYCFPQIGDTCLSLGQHLEFVAKFQILGPPPLPLACAEMQPKNARSTGWNWVHTQAVWITPEASRVKQDTDEMRFRAGSGVLCSSFVTADALPHRAVASTGTLYSWGVSGLHHKAPHLSEHSFQERRCCK